MFNGDGAPRTFDFGLVAAPSGVVFAGLSFTLRDVLQSIAGRTVAILAILAGAAISAAISPTLALASAAAFAGSELVDTVVFTILETRGIGLAIVVSNGAAAAVDSVLFVGLAFGTGSISSYAPGQFWVKLAASLVVCIPAVIFIRSRLRGDVRATASRR